MSKELFIEVEEEVTDVERLKVLTRLAAEVLDQLVRIGSASEKAVNS